MSSTTTMMVRLHPVSGTDMSGIGGTELLRMECTERPNLDLLYKANNSEESTNRVNEQSSVVSLGRNLLTMIADPTLPCNAVDVVVELSDDDTSTNDDPDGMGLSDAIRLLSDPSTFSFEQTPSNTEGSQIDIHKQPKLRLRIQRYIAGFVAINNETVSKPNAIIKEGDILSLQSMSYSYDYVLLLAPMSDSKCATTNTSTESKDVPLSVSPSENCIDDAAATSNQHYMELVDQQQKLMQQMVNDEFTCAICLEYQVLSTALVPCGHSFCNTCIIDPVTKKLKHKLCSVCNTKVTSVVPNRTIDSCFHLMAQFQSEQHRKQTDIDDESMLVSILPQEDLEHYKERADAQMNVRLNTDTNRRSKRHRPTHNTARPLPPLPLGNLEEHRTRLQGIGFPDVAWPGDEDDEGAILPYNAMFHLNFPGTPAIVTNVGRTPTVSLVRGTTPTDAIEID